MKTIGTDGRTYVLNPTKNSREFEDENKSALHLKARNLIKKELPYSTIYEEVTLMGCKGTGGVALTADFYVPDMGLIIEVHGAQHYKFNKHFYKSEEDFERAKKNDEIKREWAEMNGLTVIELPYNEVKKWKSILNDKV